MAGGSADTAPPERLHPLVLLTGLGTRLRGIAGGYAGLGYLAATGVTDGSLLAGVHVRKNCITTESIVMRASSGTIRRVSAEHRRT